MMFLLLSLGLSLSSSHFQGFHCLIQLYSFSFSNSDWGCDSMYSLSLSLSLCLWERQRKREILRQRERQKDRDRDRQREIETDWQTDRQRQRMKKNAKERKKNKRQRTKRINATRKHYCSTDWDINSVKRGRLPETGGRMDYYYHLTIKPESFYSEKAFRLSSESHSQTKISEIVHGSSIFFGALLEKAIYSSDGRCFFPVILIIL